MAFLSRAANLLPGLTGLRQQVLLARVPQAGVALADLTVELNQDAFAVGDTVVATATMTPGPGPVDAYLVLALPDGGLLSLTPGGLVPGIAPMVTDLTPLTFAGEVLRHTLTGQEPAVTYTWFAP